MHLRAWQKWLVSIFGFVVAGGFSVLTLLYPEATVQFISGKLGIAGTAIVPFVVYGLVVFTIAVAGLLVGGSILGHYFVITRKSKTRDSTIRNQVLPNETLESPPNLPNLRHLQFRLETTSDWATIKYGTGISLVGDTQEEFLRGKHNFTDSRQDSYHLNKSDSPNEITIVLVEGKFDIVHSACVYLKKGDIGYISLLMTDLDTKRELASTGKREFGGPNNNYEVRLSYN